ncbi:MAG: hypothetical protein HQM14_08270, partial [SAR324 cluster bacterium]|nr:hypothetical protein [SAR324 cluster bacterium]
KETQITDLTAEIADKETQITDLTAEIAGKNTQIDNLNTEIAGKNTQIDNLNTTVSQLTLDVSVANSQISSLNQEITATNRTLDLGLEDLVSDFQKTFKDSGFSISGGTNLQQFEKLIKAVESLNKGRKEGLYKTLK